MLKLAICDDDLLICGTVEKQILEWAEKKNRSLDIEVFHSGEGLIRHLKTGVAFDGIFLDIEMEEVSGIDVGHWLRESAGDEQTKIIYISWEKDYAMDLFKVRPMDFLLKPVTDKAVGSAMDQLWQLCPGQDQWYYFRAGNELKRVQISDIISIESANRQVRIVTESEIYSFYGKLDEAIKALDPGIFWQIHKSYSVNVNHIQTFEYEQVIVTGNRVMPISQSKRKEIRARQMSLYSGGHRHV